MKGENVKPQATAKQWHTHGKAAFRLHKKAAVSNWTFLQTALEPGEHDGRATESHTAATLLSS